jgi:carboxymethylenebutenolidase
VAIPVEGGTIPGYYAKPSGPGPFPIVLVNEEVFGVHEYIKDICRRLAKAGYAAIAPEIYARLGDISKVTSYDELNAKFISKAPDSQVMSDLDSAIAYAAAHGGDPNRLGVIGFCRGGRNAWLYDVHNPRVKAAVSFYGIVATPDTPIQPQSVLDVAGGIHGPLLGLYGDRDPANNIDDVQAAAAKARAAGKTIDIVIYPGAGHGFHADYRPSYVPAAAMDAWERTLAWFKKYLAA